MIVPQRHRPAESLGALWRFGGPVLHGKADPVMPYDHTLAAAEWLVGQGADLTADILPFVGHGIDEEMLELLVERLKAYVPKRIWDEAMRAEGDGRP